MPCLEDDNETGKTFVEIRNTVSDKSFDMPVGVGSIDQYHTTVF